MAPCSPRPRTTLSNYYQRILVGLIGLGLLGCQALGSTQPVVKLGLLAPFEGPYRAVGYHLLPAARLAVADAALEGVRVEWVILDTHGDPALATQRARELLIDQDVVGIIGPTMPESVAAVAPLLEESGRPWWPLVSAQVPPLTEAPLLMSGPAAAVAVQIGPPSDPWFYLDAAPPGADFAERYHSATGTAPWPLDAAAYHATQTAMGTLRCQGQPGCQAPTWVPGLTLYRGIAGQFPGEPLQPIVPRPSS